MSKYKLLRLYRLRELLKDNSDELFSPEGNRLTVVSNGFLGGQLFYSHKDKKVYGLCLKEIKDAPDDYLEQCEGQWMQAEATNYMNYADAKELLIKKGKL